MSEWTARIKGHRVWSLMETLGPSIDQAMQIEDNTPDVMEGLERLKAVLALSGKRIGASAPETTPPGPLETIANHFDAVKNEIDGFVRDHSPARITSANSLADAVLLQLSQIPSISSSEELISIIDVINKRQEEIEKQDRSLSEFRRKFESDSRELRSKLDTFYLQSQTTITNLQNQQEAERHKISTLASEQQKLFADAQESRSNTYNETLRTIQSNLSQTLTDQQGQFSLAQENRNREFTAAQTEQQKRFGDLHSEYTKTLAEQDAEFKKQRDEFVADSKKQLEELHKEYLVEAEKILNQVNVRRAEVEKLVGVIGNMGVTSGYLKTANSARNSMWLWQSITVGALTAVIWFAYHAFLPTMQGDFRWNAFATRVFLTITVGVLAAYAVSQADRFFQIEKYNRKLALELAAIDPFIALLPQDEQYKFKLEIGRRSFGQEELSAPAKNERSPATVLDVVLSKEGQQAIQTVADLLKNATK